GYEAPPEADFGRLAGHLGGGHKVRLIRADSLHFDFGSLAPLDFVFLDGAHDFEHVLSDTRQAYAALRPGGCLVWHDFDSGVGAAWWGPIWRAGGGGGGSPGRGSTPAGPGGCSPSRAPRSPSSSSRDSPPHRRPRPRPAWQILGAIL